MADTVRYLMEAMVPELEALKAKGYFSKQELRSIAQQRTNFEYALKRKQALLQDYVKCVHWPTLCRCITNQPVGTQSMRCSLRSCAALAARPAALAASAVSQTIAFPGGCTLSMSAPPASFEATWRCG